MLFKALKSEKLKGLGAISYCLNERTEQGTARILKGDKNLTDLLIKSNPYKEKAFFGVLSFSEKAESISDEKKLEIIAEFEKAIFGDFMLPHINTLWVEHSDKNGRLELNVIVPSINCSTKKSYTPYFHARDKARSALFCEIINIENDFTSPFDPANKQRVKVKNRKNDYHIQEYRTLTQLDKLLQDLVIKGELDSRDEIIAFLIDNGAEIGEISSDSIAVKLPKSKRFRKLQGSIYAEQFTERDGLYKASAEISRKTAEYQKTRTRENALNLRKRLENAIKRINERNAERHGEAIKNAIAERARANKRANDRLQDQNRELRKQSEKLGEQNRVAHGRETRENSVVVEVGSDSISIGSSDNVFIEDGLGADNQRLSELDSREPTSDRHSNNNLCPSGCGDSTSNHKRQEQERERERERLLAEYYRRKKEKEKKENDSIRESIERREREIKRREREIKENQSQLPGQFGEIKELLSKMEKESNDKRRDLGKKMRDLDTKMRDLDTKMRDLGEGISKLKDYLKDKFNKAFQKITSFFEKPKAQEVEPSSAPMFKP